jgi:hypothetical protein
VLLAIYGERNRVHVVLPGLRGVKPDSTFRTDELQIVCGDWASAGIKNYSFARFGRKG